MKRVVILILLFITTGLFAQRGKNGNVTISSTKVVNEYTTLTADITAGATSITVANSALNTKGRFSGNLAAGDLVMIIQMQGATINGALTSKYVGNANTATPNDSSWGLITSYGNAGLYEFAQVSAVPNATTIQFDCGLTNAYTAAGRVQVIRVPRYNTLTVNSGDTIKCDPWDSAKGGIVAIEVLGNTVINGVVSSSGLGFRGGILSSTMDSSDYGVNNEAVDAFLMAWGKLKGEGIAGYGWSYDQYGGRYAKGAAANAGGGANAHNSGGGGGANAGSTTGWINGYGNPDVSNANYIKAWNLEFSWMSTFKGSGGGRGGYTFSSNAKDPTTNAPNNSNWGGDKRAAQGGLGGRPLDYSTGRIFMGGGGGAGDQDNNVGGAGGNGGGIVYLVSYGTVSGSGQIIANGANGTNSTYVSSSNAGDGAGGAGGGGAIIVNSVSNISGITISANGGNGGNQVIGITTAEAEGPGGGGGGGYIATSNTGLTETVNGGANGTTNAVTMKKFLPNGATMGGVGTTATLSNFHIVALNDTICNGQSATLTASVVGTPPGGSTLTWYATASGGAALTTGTTYTTGPITKDTVIYVAVACPYTYRQAVNVIVNGSSSISVAAPSTICKGDSVKLSASGGTAYTWKPSTGLSSSTVSGPMAAPANTTTYTVFITTPCGQLKDSVKITVNPSLVVSFSGNETICKGASTTVTASGGTSYTWSPATGLSSTNIANPVANPTVTTTYSVSATNGSCSKDTTVTITVNPIPAVKVNPDSGSICTGGSITLNASGASTYAWSPSASLNTSTGASVVASPSGNTTYTVIGNSLGCTDTVKVPVKVGSALSVSIKATKDTICSGSSTVLTATGGGSYSWNTSATSSSVNVSPTAPTTYKVIVSSGSCKDSATLTINVSPAFKPTITGNSAICTGKSTTLTATGGGTYLWSTGSTNASITVTPAADTTYSVTVTNGACSPDTSIKITVNPMPVPVISKPQTICAGTQATLTASGGTTYAWSTGATNTAINVSPANTTTYSVVVANGGCTASDSVTVSVDPVPVGIANGTATIVSGQSTPITVLPVTSGETYSWSPANGLSCTTCASLNASPTVTTTYSVLITDSTGCTKIDSVTITVKEECGDIFIPQAFSPGQAKNNVLYVRGGCLKTMDFEVFDRWGNKVFESTDPSTGWDGMFSGQAMNSGTYVYYLKATNIYGDNIEQKGNITLVR